MSNEKPSVSDIVANPKNYGFEWYNDNVRKGDLGPWSVPLVKHIDVDLLRATFGDNFFIEQSNGTSRHVTNQRIGRDLKAEKPLTSELTIKTAIVENMLGMKSKRRTVTEVEVFRYNGVKYANIEEMRTAARADLVEAGYPADMIEHFVARLSGALETVK